jgi:enoyl-CoA hydratase
MAELVLTEREGGIVTVTLNRPEKLNALVKAMWTGLNDAFATLEADDTVRAIVLRGAGERAFAPGADIGEFETERGSAAQARTYGLLMHEVMRRIGECRHPTVALIQGLCVGGGLELAMLCDIRICGTSSRFGVPINRIGVTMGYPEIAALIALVGRTAALEILLEGRVFDAEEAKEKGLVTRIVADDQVVAEAYAAAKRIATGAPLVNRWHKKFARRVLNPAPITPAEFDEAYATFDTADFQNGFRSFLAKRTPDFEGK